MRMIKQKRIRREKSALFSGKITLITCGRLVEQKGYPYLIKAFRIVKNNIANIQLLILGKGPLETELKEQIKREHLIRDVKLLGFKNNPYFYYYHSDFFIFSSLYEGFGNVLVEAMACGLAIISTDCSYGPREIICSEETKYPSEKLQNYKICSYGILLPSLTISDSEKKIQFWAGKLTQAIKRLLKDKELLKKMRDMNVKRALLFDLDVMGKSYSTQLFPQNNH
jgi:glycosyltransferase involved in cell wall biosynthesis